MTRRLALLSIVAFYVCAWTSPASAADSQTAAPQPQRDREPGTPESQPVGGGRIKVLLVGGRGHDWKGFHEAIAPVLEKTGEFQLTLTEKLDDLKADNLSKYKVALFYGSGGDFSDPKQEEGLQDFVKNGGGLAGVHATDAFKKSDVYWRLLGGRFTTHGGGKFWLRIEDKQHPITTATGDFEIQDETYQSEYHPDFKLHSLGRIDRGSEQQSMIWAQEYGKGRVFNTTLGHDGAAWKNRQFERLLARGLQWAAGRKPKEISLDAGKRNVALASEGGYVVVDSLSLFGRNDGTYGGFDFECGPQQLNDGRHVTDPTLRLPHGNRWISQVDRKHPHWAWIGFASPRRISRVVVRCSSVENYPTDFRGQYSLDNGVTVRDLLVVRDQKPDSKTMAMEFKFDPVLVDNFRLFIDRSATTTHSNFTQLSEIEVYGEGDEIRPQVKSAPGLRDAKPLLIPAADDQVQMEERADEIEVRSRWQRLIFARGQPQITYLSWDSEGQGKLDINLLGTKGVDGIQPRVAPAYSPVKPLPAANLKREGNVVRYGPFEVADGLWMNWEIKVGAKDLEMAVMKEATHATAVRPGLVRFDMDAGQTPIGPFYRPGKLGFVGLPCLLQAPDCGAVLVESAPGSMAGFAERAAECQARGKTWWSYFDLTDEFPTRPDGLVEIKPGVRQGRMRWSVQHVTPVPSLTAKEPRLAGLSRYALNGMAFRPDTDLLGNSITSINCGFCMFEYAEVAQWLPILPGGINPCDLLRRSLDTYFAGTWAHDSGPNRRSSEWPGQPSLSFCVELNVCGA